MIVQVEQPTPAPASESEQPTAQPTPTAVTQVGGSTTEERLKKKTTINIDGIDIPLSDSSLDSAGDDLSDEVNLMEEAQVAVGEENQMKLFRAIGF